MDVLKIKDRSTLGSSYITPGNLNQHIAEKFEHQGLLQCYSQYMNYGANLGIQQHSKGYRKCMQRVEVSSHKKNEVMSFAGK